MFKTTPAVNASVKPDSHYRWFIVALIFLITIINYFDRSALSYAIGPIKQEFGLNNADFGFIAAAFGVGYVVMTLVGGLLVDHYGSHKIWAGAATSWSLVTMLLGLASSFWMFCLFRALLGLAEGPHFPALTRSITDF
jgi:sugar phosphate permease